MEPGYTQATADSTDEVDVSRLELSSLDNPADDEVFTSSRHQTTDTGRDRDDPDTVKREASFNRPIKKQRSTGYINSSKEDARLATRRRLIKRADSLESVMGQPMTSRSILKRISMTEFLPYTDRPRLVSLNRRVSIKGSHSEPLSPIDPNSRGMKKNVSFARLPSDSTPTMDMVDTGRRQSLRQTLERRQSLFQSPEKPRGPMRRRESMMNMLPSDLVKKDKTKFDNRGRYKSPTPGIARKERSSDEILTSSKKEPPPHNKRMSMPALQNRSVSNNSLRSDDNDGEVFISTFDRRKPTLLSSLEKIGVQLLKRTSRNMSLDEEAGILNHAATDQRHGTLTSRTLVGNFTDRPLGKKKSQARLAPSPSTDREISEVTKDKLKKIFDKMTKEEAKVVAMPVLEGRNRHSLPDDEIAASTLDVFRSRLRRRRALPPLNSDTRAARASHGNTDRAHSIPTMDSLHKAAHRAISRASGTNNNMTGGASHRAGHIGRASQRAGHTGRASDRTGHTGRTSHRAEHTGRASHRAGDADLSNDYRCTTAGAYARLTASLFSAPNRACMTAVDPEVAGKDKMHVGHVGAVGKLLSTTDTHVQSGRISSDGNVFTVSDPGPRKKPNDSSGGKCEAEGSHTEHHEGQVLCWRQKPSTASWRSSDRTNARQAQILAKLRTAVLARTAKPNKLAALQKKERGHSDPIAGHGDPHTPKKGEKSTRKVATADAVSRLVLVAKRQARVQRRRNRFRNLAKFICLLLRAWRVHAMAINAILDFVNTIDVTVDSKAKDALLFDITEYKADTEARLSQETIRILKKRPHERTAEEVHTVQIALWNYQSLAEYPVDMQKMIAERAWLESYGPKRVIVREGHLPMCFYFVLSGSALVSVMDVEKGVAKTIMYYNRGDSFGEPATMNRSRRQSTVISKENMQLLVLTDTDFVEVFMSRGLKDPDDPFLNSLSYLDGWPKEKLAENPKRGTILVPDSLNNDWIIIVKSGSVSLLKKLKKVYAKKAIAQRRAKSFLEKLRELAEEEAQGEVTHEERVQHVMQARQEELEKVGHLARFYALPEICVDTNNDYIEMKRLHDELTELHGAHLLAGREIGSHTPMSEQQLSRGASNTSLDRQGTGTSLDHHKLSSLVRKGPFMAKARPGEALSGENTTESRKGTSLSALFGNDTQSDDQMEVKPAKTPAPPIFVNVQTLTKGMAFGLSDIFFDHQPAMVLVSNGAECISISKKLFMEHASHAFVTRIREDIYPYPTEEDLQENLEAQICWDSHRRDVVTHVTHDLIWKRANKNDARFNLPPALGY